jgi:hypothetical protein
VLPWLDSIAGEWDMDRSRTVKGQENNRPREDRTPAWVTVARSVGAFVGIAFALVRKLSLFFCFSDHSHLST